MRLRHIEIFHAIYTTGSITNAAKLLNVSQPSVSKVLSHAEIQLGFKLFDRVKGRLIPTKEAEMLFDEVDKIYQQMRSIKNTATNIKKSEFGNISLGITPALGFDVLPNAVAAFHKEHPKVSFNIQAVHNEAVLQALFEHKCDFAVLFSPNPVAGIKTIEFGQSELVVVYPKSKFPHCPKKLSLAELQEYEFIDIGESGPLGDVVWHRILEEHIKLKFPIKVETYFIAARLVARGLGVCVVDRYTAMGNLTDDIGVASFDPAINFPVNGIYLENRGLPKVAESFIPFLKKEIIALGYEEQKS